MDKKHGYLQPQKLRLHVQLEVSFVVRLMFEFLIFFVQVLARLNIAELHRQYSKVTANLVAFLRAKPRSDAALQAWLLLYLTLKDAPSGKEIVSDSSALTMLVEYLGRCPLLDIHCVHTYFLTSSCDASATTKKTLAIKAGIFYVAVRLRGHGDPSLHDDACTTLSNLLVRLWNSADDSQPHRFLSAAEDAGTEAALIRAFYKQPASYFLKLSALCGVLHLCQNRVLPGEYEDLYSFGIECLDGRAEIIDELVLQPLQCLVTVPGLFLSPSVLTLSTGTLTALLAPSLFFPSSAAANHRFFSTAEVVAKVARYLTCSNSKHLRYSLTTLFRLHKHGDAAVQENVHRAVSAYYIAPLKSHRDRWVSAAAAELYNALYRRV
jgi:hypothetical protein